MVNPFRRIATSVAEAPTLNAPKSSATAILALSVTLSISKKPLLVKALRLGGTRSARTRRTLRRRSYSIQNRFQGCSHAILGVGRGYLPTPSPELLRRISHNNWVSGKGKHFYVVVIVTDGHDPVSGNPTEFGPPLKRVPLRASGVQDVHNRQVTFRIFSPQH